MKPERSDAELLAAARHADRAAIEELLERHERQIYRFGLRMCGNEDDAREVLQETLLAAFRNLPEFRGDAALSTWLYQIARSFCIKELRRGHPTEPLDDEVADPEPAPDTRTHAREIGAALAAAVSALPPDFREVVVLRDVEGLSADEAARIVGIEVGALKSRLHRARQELRTHLAALLGEHGEPGGAAPCLQLTRALSTYVSSDIDQATCIEIQEHLETCPRCAGACADLERSVALCRRIPGNDVPAPVRAAVRHALLALALGR